MKYFDIPDFTGYKVDKKGNIYSYIPQGCRDRFDRSKWLKKPKIVKPRLTHGYCRVYIRRDSTGKREDVYVHRLVAYMFLNNPYNLPEVNHKDSNPMNNALSNLEWTDHKGNYEHAINYGYARRDKKTGRFKKKKKSKKK